MPLAFDTSAAIIQIRTVVVAALGGGLMHLLQVPLAWMIGAMIGAALLSWHAPVDMPRWARPTGLVALTRPPDSWRITSRTQRSGTSKRRDASRIQGPQGSCAGPGAA